MASTKEYRDFILEQLSEAPNITCRPMMGEFLLYSNNVLFGGIYDDRLLVKIVSENEQYKMTEEIPYDGAKPMFLVEDVDDKEKLAEIVNATVKGLNE
ncbi:TfoX/Sxy family protein [Candidatus Saccharibacteria bacterium]|nr:TfoX/Sxy family protein [Candidatus Saccharibacteria bacterium]MBR3256060.1 TfoX/Sxy family protein [Candidatus Saccharibacteria bacterium]